jgi:hypothetical protein
MSQYQKFIFKRYEFNKEARELNLYYSFDDSLNFCETYRFDFDFVNYEEAAFQRALQLLFFMAGVSYYKMYMTSEIQVENGLIDGLLSDFLSKTYEKGLGEFFYINKLSPHTLVRFPINADSFSPIQVSNNSGMLVGIGGGKDSLVSVELVRGQPDVATWSLNHRSQLEPLIRQVGLSHFWVERTLDPQILELNKQGALNGHIPISAILACVGTIVAILSGYRDVVVSNESSASEPNLRYEDVDINHQYSKSLEFEKDYQEILAHYYDKTIAYYSLLRPFTELRIAELFTKVGFHKYKDVFSSCNRAYTHDQHELFWCGECPKCAFVFLALTPFIDKEELVQLWHGKNLLLDPSLEPTYRQLLGIEGNKPLECVGEVKESRAAMHLAQAIYPELNKYSFYLPDNYDFRVWSEHSMPEEVFSLVKDKVKD